MATLPPELRARAGRVRERFVLDAPGWFDAGDEPVHLAVVADAVWNGERLDIRYGRGERVVARRVDPLGLVNKAGTWYVVASHRGQPRTYRLDRVVSARPAPGAVQRPDGFDLAEWWRTSNDEFDQSLLRTRIRVRLDPTGVRSLTHVVGRPAAEPALADASPFGADGWVTVDLRVESEQIAAAQLIGLGPHVEVVEPVTLRRHMAETGAAIAALHPS
jgi:predicted DNA-binding transcriptional regulator YafY